MLEETLRLALGFRLLVEVEPGLPQIHLVQPVRHQVLAQCFKVGMEAQAVVALAQVASTAPRQEQVAGVGVDCQHLQQLDLLVEMAELPLALGCLAELLQVEL